MHMYIQSSASWLNEHIKSYIRKHLPDAIAVDDFEDLPADAETVFQYCDGWAVTRNFAVLNSAKSALINAYPNSDALSRKDLLAKIVEFWSSKRPSTALKDHVPLTVRLELDYAEYVEESLMEADNLELLYSLEENAEKPGPEREWWILKPALVDCGAGIRIFSTIDELAGNLELIDGECDDESSEDAETSGKPSGEDEGEDDVPYMTASVADRVDLDVLVNATGTMSLGKGEDSERKPKREQYVFEANGRIPSAHMRAFVAQRYIATVPALDGRKWHVRAYVLCIGRLKVYVYRELLALLAGEKYEPPWENPSLKASLTNTALQEKDDYIARESMRDFWSAPDDLLPGDWKQSIFDQICEISGEVVAAATHTMADKFTPLDKCFELFAADYHIDANGHVWLLEVNETPAFYEVGMAGPLAKRLMESVVCMSMEHMGENVEDNAENAAAKERMVKVLDETATLAKSNITQIISEQDI